MGARAYTRLNVDERRRRLLERATRLFATHGYDELSMAKLARALLGALAAADFDPAGLAGA